MDDIAQGILTLSKPSVGMLHSLTAGIEASRFARFASGAAGPILANHPAWLVGHLAIYPHRALSLVGEDPDAPAVVRDGSWDGLFGKESDCLDDPSGSVYPPRDEILDVAKAEMARLVDRLAGLSDERLMKPQPLERWKERFPVVRDSFVFLMGPHAMFHLGQLSTWRRAEGLPSVM